MYVLVSPERAQGMTTGGHIMSKLFTKVQNEIAGRQADARDEGATMVEYGLIVSLIAIVVIVAVTAIGTNLSSTFNTIAGKL